MRKSAALVLLALAGCNPAAPDLAATAPKEPAAITPDAYEPYDRQNYPNLFKLLADDPDPAARIQRAREAFALRVAAHPDCDFVDTVDVAIDGSTSDELRLFAYCKNATHRLRFRTGESTLQRPGEPVADLRCPAEGFPCERI